MITIHGMGYSGNCYKPRLLCALLGIQFRHVDVSLADGETRKAPFLAKNPNGKVPLMELEDGTLLPESNAILWYLGEDTRFVPTGRLQRAQMLSWMFFEQYSHEPAIAVRISVLMQPHRKPDATPERLAATLKAGNAALAVMAGRLAEADFFVGDAPSLADIALYAYTHNADEGGFDLDRWPSIRTWLARIEALDGYKPMSWLP